MILLFYKMEILSEKEILNVNTVIVYYLQCKV